MQRVRHHEQHRARMEEEGTEARSRQMVVNLARASLAETVARYTPVASERLPIIAVAVCGMFADLISGLSTGTSLAETVNIQLEQSGYRLIQTPRN